MNLIKLIVYSTLLILVVLVTSCKSKYATKTYVMDRGLTFQTVDGIEKPTLKSDLKKSITFISDTTLNFTVLRGHIGWTNTVKYKIENSLLKIDTMDINNKNLRQGAQDEIFGKEFLFYKDSIIDNLGGQKYYLSE